MRGPKGPCLRETLDLGVRITDNQDMKVQRVVQKMELHPVDRKPSGDLQYWLSQPVEARLAAVEELRRQTPGYDAEPRLQRVCRVIDLKPG